MHSSDFPPAVIPRLPPTFDYCLDRGDRTHPQEVGSTSDLNPPSTSSSAQLAMPLVSPGTSETSPGGFKAPENPIDMMKGPVPEAYAEREPWEADFGTGPADREDESDGEPDDIFDAEGGDDWERDAYNEMYGDLESFAV